MDTIGTYLKTFNARPPKGLEKKDILEVLQSDNPKYNSIKEVLWKQDEIDIVTNMHWHFLDKWDIRRLIEQIGSIPLFFDTIKNHVDFIANYVGPEPAAMLKFFAEHHLTVYMLITTNEKYVGESYKAEVRQGPLYGTGVYIIGKIKTDLNEMKSKIASADGVLLDSMGPRVDVVILGEGGDSEDIKTMTDWQINSFTEDYILQTLKDY